MNNFSKELCWTIKRFFPLWISLIFLGFFVEEFKEILPPFIESGHVTTIQYLITIGIFIYAIWNMRKIISQVKTGLTRNQIITFGAVVFVARAEFMECETIN